jgi:osmotically-inducible protein OsmY
MLRRPEPIIDRTEDPRIQRDVESRLAAEPALDASRIRVEVDGAIVVLYGSVPGIAGWNCAIRNAQMVAGVMSVVDYLVIERGDREIRCLLPTPAAFPTTT